MLYELLLIAKSDDSESAVSNVEKIVKGQSDSVKVNKLGKKSLAYPISGQTEADYTIFNFEAEGAAIWEISNKLRLEQESILRYLIVKPAGKAASTLKIPVDEKKKAKVTVKTVGSKSGSKETKKAKPKGTQKAKKGKRSNN